MVGDGSCTVAAGDSDCRAGDLDGLRGFTSVPAESSALVAGADAPADSTLASNF